MTKAFFFQSPSFLGVSFPGLLRLDLEHSFLLMVSLRSTRVVVYWTGQWSVPHGWDSFARRHFSHKHLDRLCCEIPRKGSGIGKDEGGGDKQQVGTGCEDR